MAQTRLTRSGRAYIQYRKNQCSLAASLGGGAIGNALDIRRIACAAALNLQHAKLLLNASAEIPSK